MPKVNGSGQAAILSNEQIDRVIERCRAPHKFAVAIAAYTGCRMGEAIALRAENLDLNEGILTFTKTKTGRVREIELHPELIAILTSAELPQEGWLFPSRRKPGGRISRQSIDAELRAVCADMGLKGVGTHSFRRSLATNLHGKSIPLKTIAAITGHASLDSLARYIDVTPEQRRSAIMAR
jgi:integrase/recombinase XerD